MMATARAVEGLCGSSDMSYEVKSEK